MKKGRKGERGRGGVALCVVASTFTFAFGLFLQPANKQQVLVSAQYLCSHAASERLIFLPGCSSSGTATSGASWFHSFTPLHPPLRSGFRPLVITLSPLLPFSTSPLLLQAPPDPVDRENNRASFQAGLQPLQRVAINPHSLFHWCIDVRCL